MWVKSQVPQPTYFYYFFPKASEESEKLAEGEDSSLLTEENWVWHTVAVMGAGQGKMEAAWLDRLPQAPDLHSTLTLLQCIGGSALLLLLHCLRPFCERDEWEASAGDCTALNYNLKSTQGGISQVIQSHPSSMRECRTVPRVKIQHVSIEQHAGQTTQQRK